MRSTRISLSPERPWLSRASVAQTGRGPSGQCEFAGARYIGTNYDETGTLKVPQKTLFDAMVAYTQGSWRFAVNAANITDQRYNASCLARGDCFYGPRRSIVGSARYRF